MRFHPSSIDSLNLKRSLVRLCFDKRDAIEKEIASLKETLDGFQSDEYRRYSDMIKERSLKILATSSSSDAALTIGRTDSKKFSGVWPMMLLIMRTTSSL